MISKKGLNVGQGHGGNSNLPVIREVTNVSDSRQKALLEQMEPGTRVFRMGKCLIFLSPPHKRKHSPDGWHISISCPDRYPTWDELAKAWYELVPESEKRTAVMLLPPKKHYVNIHNFCFQVHEIPGEDADGRFYGEEGYVRS